MLDPLWRLLTHDIAIDLGTANTVVAVRGEGIVINEPSVVAINKENNQILAVGAAAKEMLGKTPGNLSAVRPLKDGVISDFDAAEAMIRYFIEDIGRSYGGFKLNRPRVVIGVPSLITEVEVMAVIDAARSAGARRIYIIEEPMAAAIGSGLDVEDSNSVLIVDIGGGTTDIALISMGGMVIDKTINVAGDEMNEAIIDYVRHKYNLLIGEKTAENTKIEIGSIYPKKKESTAYVSGRDLQSGLPRSIEVTSIEIREALEPVLEQIIAAVKAAIEEAPPESVADMLKNGITLAGGGSLLEGIDKYFSEHLKVPVNISPEPKMAVVNGVYFLLDRIPLLEKIQRKDSAFF